MPTVVATVVNDKGELDTQHHEIENSSNFTVIVHQQGIKVDVPDFVEINSETTIKCMAEMTQKAWQWVSTGPLFQTLFKAAFAQNPDILVPKQIEVLNIMDKGVIHVAGMIVQGCEALFAGKSIFVRNPETYLHPKVEQTIVDMFQKMMEFCGVKGEITTATGEKPKPKTKKQEKEERKVERLKAKDRKNVTILWLQTMEPDKQVAKYKSKIYTASQLINAIKRGYPVGKEIVETYFAAFGI